jgi:chromosome segregation ATPase
MTSPQAPPPAADDADFEQALAEVERSLQALRTRYAQVKRDQDRQKTLQQQLRYTQNQLNHRRTQPLRDELKQLQKQLDDLEIALESKLFSWSGAKEVFWQAIRFMGLGVVIGWVLKSCAG